MLKFDSTVAGIPCVIKVTHYEPYRPAYISGLPEDCYPAEGGAEWIVCDSRGRVANWLERKMSEDDRERIDGEIFTIMGE